MRATTQDQHFVPKFYLRRFADADNWIQVLDLKRRKVVKPRPYTSVCWSKFFYAANEGESDAVSQAIEQLFGQIETRISKDWDGILDRARSSSLNLEDFKKIAQLVAMLMLRTRGSRDNFNMNMENIRALMKNR